MNVLLFIQAIAPLLPQVVKLTEKLIPGPKKGRKKRARAIKTIETLAAAVPELAAEIDKVSKEVGKQVDSTVAKMNKDGSL